MSMKFLQSCDERCSPWWWQGQRCSSQEAGARGCGGASSPTSRPPPGRCRWNKETMLVSRFKFFPIICQHSYWRTYWKNIFDVLLLVHLYLLQSVKCSVSSHILFVCPNSISLITVEIINQPPISKVLYSYKSFILRMGGVVWPICEHLFWSSKILNIRLLKTVLEMQGFRLVTLALSELLNV